MWEAKDYLKSDLLAPRARTTVKKPAVKEKKSAVKEKKVAAKAKKAAARLTKVSRKEVTDADWYVAIGNLTDSLIAD